MYKRLINFDRVIPVISLLVYLALAVWMTRVWLPLGDEPHYLLAAHSLVYDHDLNLANNYANRDFQTYSPGGTLDPHVKILPDGTQILNHDLGLPILIALPYALGGRAGVEIFLALCAALLAWQMWKLAFDVTGNRLWATAAWLLLGFTPPLVMYATLIYPELVGALIFLWGARTVLFKRVAELSLWQVVLVALGVVALPWLSVRFVVLVVLLLVFVTVRGGGARGRVVGIYASAALGLAAYFFVNHVLFAGVVPKGSPTELAGQNLVTLSAASLARGVLGWWIDPQRGTLILAPIYLMALAGIPRLLRRNIITGGALLAPLIVLVPLVAVLGGFWIPFEVGARYFVVGLPLLAAPLALALQAGFSARAQWSRIAFGGLTLFLALVSVWNGTLMLSDAAYAYGSVVTAYSRALGSDVSPYFASMGDGILVDPNNSPSGNDAVAVEQRDGQAVWVVPKGNAGTILQSYDLTELTVGHYVVDFRAQAQGGAADPEVLTFDIFSTEGLPLVHTTWSGKDLQSDVLHRYTVEFDNPYFDRWGLPLSLQVATSGSADLVLTGIHFDPDNVTTWVRAGIWVALLLGVMIVLNLDILAKDLRRSLALITTPTAKVLKNVEIE